jgi:hypothetical protein
MVAWLRTIPAEDLPAVAGRLAADFAWFSDDLLSAVAEVGATADFDRALDAITGRIDEDPLGVARGLRASQYFLKAMSQLEDEGE